MLRVYYIFSNFSWTWRKWSDSGINWKIVTQNIVPIASVITKVINSPYHFLSSTQCKTKKYSFSHTSHQRLHAAPIFLLVFNLYDFFFKNVSDYRNRSNFVNRPNQTYSLIWNKIFAGQKKAHSLFLYDHLPAWELRIWVWNDLPRVIFEQSTNTVAPATEIIQSKPWSVSSKQGRPSSNRMLIQ